jgi:hypothetical protein
MAKNVKKDLYIPFSVDGKQMQTWTGTTFEESLLSYDWRLNYTFKDTLQITDWCKGRSRVNVIAKDSIGVKYYFFFNAFMWVVKNLDIHKGKVTGEWTFTKQGANYGLIHV